MDKKKVLIIDDEMQFCELVRMNFEMSGKFLVFKAFDGKDGIKKANGVNPDIILLDIMMPKMDGFEVLQVLKQDPKTMEIPIIMLSARSEDAAKIKASEMYSTYYITKPVSADELIAKIEWALGLPGK